MQPGELDGVATSIHGIGTLPLVGRYQVHSQGLPEEETNIDDRYLAVLYCCAAEKLAAVTVLSLSNAITASALAAVTENCCSGAIMILAPITRNSS